MYLNNFHCNHLIDYPQHTLILFVQASHSFMEKQLYAIDTANNEKNGPDSIKYIKTKTKLEPFPTKTKRTPSKFGIFSKCFLRKTRSVLLGARQRHIN